MVLHRTSTPSVLPLLLLLLAACGSSSTDAASSAAASAAPVHIASAAPSTSATSSAAPQADLSVLGGPDWKAVFAGPAPVKLNDSMGGGHGTGMADDYTVKTSHAEPMWKYNNAGGGGVYWSPTKKAIAVSNINLKLDATPKAVDTWIKSALVTAVQHTGEPQILEVGADKAVAKTGAGTCKLKGGEDADFYWWDVYSSGDFSHQLMMVIVAKDAPDEEKKVALSILRQVSYTAKAKPHYKK